MYQKRLTMNFKGFLVAIYSLFSLLIVIVMMYFFRQKIPLIRKLWAFSMIKIIGVDIENTGTLDASADLIALNHNSMLDIILLDYLHPADIAWVTNIKLANVPVFGWIFKLPNLILIDPLKRSSLRILTNRTREEVANKRLIGLFPEGTRGDTNDMTDFQKGGQLIAERLNLKVQPIVLIGTRERLNTKTVISTPGQIKVIYLDAIKPSNKEWFEKTEKTMKDTYNKLNGKI